MSYSPPNVQRGFGSLLWISLVVALSCGAVFDAVLAISSSQSTTANGIGNALFGVLLVAFVALPICFVCGALLAPIAPPVFRRLGLASLHGYIFGGAVCGSLALTGLALVTIGFVPRFFAQFALGLVPGAVAGCLWWISVERPQTRIERHG